MNRQFFEYVTKGVLQVVFFCYAAVFAGWWYVSPKGFPWEHLRFWSNGVIPMIIILASLACMVGAFGRWRRILSILIPAYPAGTLAFIAVATVLYPVSMRALFLISLLGWLAVLAGLTAYVLRRDPLKKPDWVPAGLLICLAVVIGAALPWSQRSALAATRPLNPLDSADVGLVLNPATVPFELSGQVVVQPQRAQVDMLDLNSKLTINPLLTFYSRSPDRCWTLFASQRDRIGNRRRYEGMRRTDNGLHLEYTADGKSLIDITTPEQGVVELDARCELPKAIYSHLNTFTQFTVEGREKIFVSFSPCPDERIEVTAFDYPFGRPCRMAYLDPSGVFRVVQAKSAEKGPFETLAEGSLKGDQGLEIVLYDGDKAIYRVTLEDWAAQCSRQLSPTAGWGLPENAIEFSLDGENPRQATFYITLASTSAGCGFDSVGHAAGIYRNWMRVEILRK